MSLVSIDEYQQQMEWEKGQAEEHCSERSGCIGPTVCNVSHGPDGGGRMIVSACEGCAHRLKAAISGVNISVRGEPEQ